MQRIISALMTGSVILSYAAQTYSRSTERNVVASLMLLQEEHEKIQDPAQKEISTDIIMATCLSAAKSPGNTPKTLNVIKGCLAMALLDSIQCTPSAEETPKYDPRICLNSLRDARALGPDEWKLKLAIFEAYMYVHHPCLRFHDTQKAITALSPYTKKSAIVTEAIYYLKVAKLPPLERDQADIESTYERIKKSSTPGGIAMFVNTVLDDN